MSTNKFKLTKIDACMSLYGTLFVVKEIPHLYYNMKYKKHPPTPNKNASEKN
jgi:hypothetical protein